ncbi:MULTISPECIES: vWA domain-containing protein [unclassified Tolypothrix]|uniref:vWA domain-containing protein n=1 Tax=unclassified Tolypothrix TaxID=2649714 RepID=UPI0005EAC7AD|nr:MULTISPECIES: VWA domain-containing protein [unclassified Tolypothrix]BAY95339.1 von Willebrand factor type A [Microchaete diplosiphon NIES-3275]EKE96704.1 von Willebrand factor type A domain protein [Tolypothrix sp. PCC 7601]MBE9084558.1 VWA domain-containing protein [Tolypothrix sp. LEGE 11397]UYD30558.1 VWA domain-containing protein [Tolypothrix sp. PCC 7712]UYD38311.1 VWA domain-containing protein [Tolypothrix sp. PCC 7601]
MSNVLNVYITPHREFLPAETEGQKLFLMLKLRPTKEVAVSRPPTTFAFVIDTSGSMYEVVAGATRPTGVTYTQDGKEYNQVTGGKSKIDIVMESLLALVRSGRLGASDRVAIVQFDDTASQIIGLTPATQVSQLENAITQLRSFSGGTRMGLGLRRALDLLAGQDMAVRRTLLFTDGHTFDEDICREIASDFATKNIPITALGVGEDFREDLLTHLSDSTAGSSLYVVPGTAIGTQVSILDLPNKIIEEYSQAQQEVITNLALTVKTVKGIELTRIVRAYPTQAEFPLTQEPYPIGNAAASDETIFILEFSMNSRPASRVRIAQMGLTYDIPGQNRRGELPPQNLVVQFVAGQGSVVQVDQEVMDYVQQCNISNLVNQATKIADRDPQKAEELLETARRMTVRIGNKEMEASLNGAQQELRKTRQISAGTRKTVKMGAKGKTVKMGNDINDQLSEEEMRKLTGT